MSKIYQTNDYGLFESITGNRSLSQSKIERICNDVSEGFNMLPYCPIIVSERQNGNFGVIDGQHRLEVSKKLGEPVYYVVCDTLTLKQIAQLNSRGEKWKPADFLNCYIQLGIDDYNKLNEVVQEFGVAIRTAADMLMTFKVKDARTVVDAFQSGEFKCNYLEETREILSMTNKLFGRYVFSKDRHLIGAVQVIMKKGKCDFEKLSSKLKAAPMMMDKQADIKSYVYNIERVYNFKSQTREVLS